LPGDYIFNDFGGPTTLFFQSRFVNDTNVAQTRFITGLKGDLPFLENIGLNNWAYDVFTSYSRSSGQDSVSGIPFFPRLEQTLANTTLDEDGIPVCEDRTIPREGQTIQCRPLDFLSPTFLFEGRFDDPLDTEYLFPNRLTDTVVKQNILSGYMSGDLFEIPTGGMIVAGFGGEIREDIIETRTSLAGDFQGFLDDPGSNGARKLEEVFGEIELPLLKDQPFAHELSLNLAGRLDVLRASVTRMIHVVFHQLRISSLIQIMILIHRMFGSMSRVPISVLLICSPVVQMVVDPSISHQLIRLHWV